MLQNYKQADRLLKELDVLVVSKATITYLSVSLSPLPKFKWAFHPPAFSALCSITSLNLSIDAAIPVGQRPFQIHSVHVQEP
jgi:hypothetical protein